MPRMRKTASLAITECEQRIAGMKSIDPRLDLGNDVSAAAGEQLLTDARRALEVYNASLATSDGLLNEFRQKEREVREFNKKVLPAGGLRFGTDSSEYEKLGGTRDSERQKYNRQKTKTKKG
ncbi:MAG: hypothetical protein JSS81_07865 [Acidobacteria bacterium]|nr:hypothetical protein [Acidobacteriota bacterium]